MRNSDWVALSDAQRGQLVSIWLLAADKKGKIPNDPLIIKKLCYMDTVPDLNLFIEHGFIEVDANVTPERRQDDANVTHQSREEESREEEKKLCTSHATHSDLPRLTIPQVINIYHEKLPTLPRVQKVTKTREGLIRQRIREDMQTAEQWENYFDHVANSDFLMGKTQPTNGRPPFRADLEWLCRPSNLAKIAEDKYHVQQTKR